MKSGLSKLLKRIFIITGVVGVLYLGLLFAFMGVAATAGDEALGANFGAVFSYYMKGMLSLFVFNYANNANIAYFSLSIFLYAMIVCWIVLLIAGVIINDKKKRKIMWFGIGFTFFNLIIYIFFAAGSQAYWQILNNRGVFDGNKGVMFLALIVLILGVIYAALSLFGYFWSIIDMFVAGEDENAPADEDEEKIREIVRDELVKNQPLQVVIVGGEAPKAEPAPVEEEPEEVEEVEEVEEAEEPANEEDAKKRERVPFMQRILKAELDTKANYNEIKNDILAYGVKSRISKNGEMFRLHTKKYVKIALVGKSLKVFLALNPEDYNDSPIPVKDVGYKPLYAEIPLLFKVKSPLSVRRCKQLIKETMEKDGLTQKEVGDTNWVNELRLQNKEDKK